MGKLTVLGAYLTSSSTSKRTDINLSENLFGTDKNDSLLHIYAGNIHYFIKILLQSINKIFQSSGQKSWDMYKNISHNYLFGAQDNDYLI